MILDDLGISPLTQEQDGGRHGNHRGAGPVRLDHRDHQLPKDKIYTAFADPTLADAICDRLFRGAIDIPLKGESRRKAATPKVEHSIHPC